jgi:hypothetical protein
MVDGALFFGVASPILPLWRLRNSQYTYEMNMKMQKGNCDVDVITGDVATVTYRNEESGYSILTVHVTGSKSAGSR